MLRFRIGKGSKGSDDDSGSDAQLVERLVQRDECAFLDLYDRHRHSVHRFLIHMTGSLAIAEELTQEAFVIVLDALFNGKFGRFDPGKGTLEGYLLGIARNLARREFHRSLRLVSLESILEVSEGKGITEDLYEDDRLFEGLALRSDLRRLQAAILELPPHYREVVVLCSLQERSYQDAAGILQCSEGTIASRMNRARALLAVKLRVFDPNAGNTPKA
ncbi:MAG: RNA polymerase sigma factor [Acidobacteriaceae bacterium]